MKHPLLSLLSLSCILAGCGSAPSSSEPEAETPFVIGAIAPLSGAATTYGIPVQRAIGLQVDAINANGGVNGQPLEVIWQDGKCTGKDAALAADLLIAQHNVPVILGGVCSGETLAAAPIAEKNEVVLLTPISKSPDITDAGDFVFRLNVSSDSFGTIMGPTFNDLNIQSVYAITEQSDFAIGTETSFEENYKGTFTAERYTADQSDFRTLLLKAKTAEPDVLMMNVQTVDKFVILARQMAEMNWTPDLLVNELIAGSPDAITALKDYPAEVYSALFQPQKTETYEALQAAYLAKFEEAPTYDDALIFPIDAIDILAEIATERGQTPTGPEIRDALYALAPTARQAGTYAFDANGDATLSPMRVQLKDGSFRPFLTAHSDPL